MSKMSKIKELVEEAKRVQKEKNLEILKEWEMEKLKNTPNLNKIIYEIQDKIMELKAIICGTTVVPGVIFKRGWLYIPQEEVKRRFDWLKPYKNGFVVKIINY